MTSETYKKIKDSTYCYLAFNGLSTHPLGKSRPCCESEVDKVHTFVKGTDTKKYQFLKNSKVANTIDEYINDPELKKIRRQLLEGKRPKNCDSCWMKEDSGLVSLRQIQNEINLDNIDTSLSGITSEGDLDVQNIKYLDITLGNVCNLKCRTCSSWNSHHWIEEEKQQSDANPHGFETAEFMQNYPWFVNAFANGFFDVVLPTVTHINFIGGEPLVVKEHYDWLQRIIDKGWAKNITLSYNTNTTLIPKKLLDIWDLFKEIRLSLSLDAVGDLAYYVRYPSKWKLIERNVEKLKEYTKTRQQVVVHVHVTISVLNIHAIDQILDWCTEQYKDWHFFNTENYNHYGYQNLIPHFNLVEDPYYMNIRHLPNIVKEKVNNTLDKAYSKLYNSTIVPNWERHRLESIKNLKTIVNLNRDEKEWQNFIERTINSDRFRNIDIKDYIPWMKDYI